jgi:hypothetical protein
VCDCFRLRRGAAVRAARIVTHPNGWELRIALNGQHLLLSQVDPDPGVLMNVASHKYGVYVARGWREAEAR